jgi:hypothetical protein
MSLRLQNGQISSEKEQPTKSGQSFSQIDVRKLLAKDFPQWADINRRNRNYSRVVESLLIVL